jgi:formamidopyrimidine-DNA glycosylase
MPELPFVTTLVENLWPHVEGRTIERVLVRGVSALKTFDPPVESLAGGRITGIRRRGKLLIFDVAPGLVMVMHLRRNGRLQILPRRTGRTARDLAVAFAFDDGTDLRMIEIGPKKAASVWLFRQGEEDGREPLDGLGVEPLSSAFTVAALGELLRVERTQVKRFLTLQRFIAGIGNAFADEILWEARLSPMTLTTALTAAEVVRLHGAVRTVLETALDAHRREFAGALPMREPLHLLRIHRHGGEPCPRCGTPIAVIYYEEKETYYCPTCQTQGVVYADRRRSRLLK